MAKQNVFKVSVANPNSGKMINQYCTAVGFPSMSTQLMALAAGAGPSGQLAVTIGVLAIDTASMNLEKFFAAGGELIGEAELV